MKVLIYQVYVTSRPEVKHDALIEESTSSLKAYSDHYGIDYTFESKPTFSPEQLPNDADWRMQFYWAMDLCKPELRHYDYIVHFDADIIMKENSPDIRKELKGDFMANRDPIDYLGCWNHHITPLRRAFAFRNVSDHFGYPWYNHFNSGVWASSPKARKLIWENWQKDAFKSYEEKAPEDWPFGMSNPYGGDQNILNNIVHNSDLDFVPLDWKWNALSGGLKAKNLDEAHAIHYGAKIGKFLYNNPEYRDKTPLSKEAKKLMKEQMQ